MSVVGVKGCWGLVSDDVGVRWVGCLGVDNWSLLQVVPLASADWHRAICKGLDI